MPASLIGALEAYIFYRLTYDRARQKPRRPEDVHAYIAAVFGWLDARRGLTAPEIDIVEAVGAQRLAGLVE
jgi:hypothetical protein